MHAVFFFLPEAFCGLKYAENAMAAGDPEHIEVMKLEGYGVVTCKIKK